MKYAHFLITKFNLPHLWDKDKNGVTTQSEEWLEQRVGLFKRYCLPSIIAQTRKDFVWLLLFYDKTPDKYKKLNEELAAKYSFYKPYYLNDEESKDINAYVNKVIHEMVADDTEIIITTRFDNDDALAVDATEELETYVRNNTSKDPYMISLPEGIQYYPKYNISMPVEWKENHFLTYVERHSKKMKTAYNCNHTKVLELYMVKFAGKGKTMWMEVCHEKNIANGIHLKWAFNPLKHGFDGNRFGLTPPNFLYDCLKFRIKIIFLHTLKRRIKEKLKL